MTLCIYEDSCDSLLASGIIFQKEPITRFLLFEYDDRSFIEKVKESVRDKEEPIILLDIPFQKNEWEEIFKLSNKIFCFTNDSFQIKIFDKSFSDRNVLGKRDQSKSVSLSVWEFCYAEKEPPDIISLMNDYLVHENSNDPKATNFILALTICETNPESDLWRVLLFGNKEVSANLFQDLYHRGSIISEYLEKQKKKAFIEVV